MNIGVLVIARTLEHLIGFLQVKVIQASGQMKSRLGGSFLLEAEELVPWTLFLSKLLVIYMSHSNLKQKAFHYLKPFLAIPLKLRLVLDEKITEMFSVRSFIGNYILEETKLNAEWYWIHQLSAVGLWWDKDSKNWVLGHLSDKGTSKSMIRGPVNDNSFPNLITSGWCYWNGKYTTENKLQLENSWKSKKEGECHWLSIFGCF